MRPSRGDHATGGQYHSGRAALRDFTPAYVIADIATRLSDVRFTPKADMDQRGHDVRFVPIGDIIWSRLET